MMHVQVKLYANLRRYRPDLGHGEAAHLELPQGATLRDLLEALGIPEHETKQCFINAIIRRSDHVLKEGDEIGIFPPIAGG